MKITTIPLFFCVILTSCARIADPKPPERRVPEVVRDLEARQVGGEIILTFSLPERNTDGKAPTVRSLEIFRITEKAEADSPPVLNDLREENFLEQAAHAFSIPAARFNEYMRRNVFTIRDTPRTMSGESFYSLRFRYAVVFVNEKGQAAGLGKQAFVQPVVLPPAPEGLSAVVTENGVQITWAAVQENINVAQPFRVAYNIYRSEKPGEFTETPINVAPLPGAEYFDGDFQFGENYYYAVSVVAISASMAESALSEILKVEARDVFPPEPPGNFTAVAENGMITLFWMPSPSVDLAGYRIFRRNRTESIRSLLEEIITGISYRDKNVGTDVDYIYEIQAVDGHGNTSKTVELSIELKKER